MGQVFHPRYVNLDLSKLHAQVLRLGYDLSTTEQAKVALNRSEGEIEA